MTLVVDGTTSPAAAWHALDPADVLDRLRSAPGGLAHTEAAERLVCYGPNVFQGVRGVSLWTILAAQCRSIIVALLAVAGVVAVVTGEPVDAVAIGAVLVLNVAIGVATEFRAHRAMEALLALEVTRAQVVRDGAVSEIDARELVPGDVIVLEAGHVVPADARLLHTTECRIVEASLTGESAPVDKHAEVTLAADLPLADRRTMVYKATAVVNGRARAVVVATGMMTEVGRIGTLTESIAIERTPLEQRLDALGRRLVLVALGVAALVAALGIVQGLPFDQLIQTAIALAVAAVPEGLPVVATIAMAVGVHRMARRHALIRHLPVVDTLGAATVICTDKTGTLTAGTMTVTAVRLVDREVAIPAGTFTPSSEVAFVLRIGAVANRGALVRCGAGWQTRGDPTETALLVAATKAGLDVDALRHEWPEVADVPFSSERMLMATFHRTPDGLLACVKGAPRRIAELSDYWRTADGVRPLGSADRERLLQYNHDLADRGLRVLAVAIKAVAGTAEADLYGLTWVGLVAMSDPPAPGVRDTIHTFRTAGVRTVMLTGDQQRTAETVARDLELLGPGDGVLDAQAIARLSADELRDAVHHATVFSRVSPETKLRIVTAYRERGEIVAMLGDGVNDAPALRQADIGVAMGGRGTDLAKEAADLILTDDRFPTIASAIEEGRVVFNNIRKFVLYLFSCNLAEILVLVGAGLLGLPVPLLPLQILWLNLLTDTFPALALAVEPGDPSVMRQPPRHPDAAILSRPMLRATVGYGVVIAMVALAAFGWGLREAHGSQASHLDHARTLAFMVLAFGQISHLGNARSGGPVLTPARAFANRFAVGAVVLAVGLQVLTAEVSGLARVLGVVPLSGRDWLIVGTLSVIPGVVGQGMKRRTAGSMKSVSSRLH